MSRAIILDIIDSKKEQFTDQEYKTLLEEIAKPQNQIKISVLYCHPQNLSRFELDVSIEELQIYVDSFSKHFPHYTKIDFDELSDLLPNWASKLINTIVVREIRPNLVCYNNTVYIKTFRK